MGKVGADEWQWRMEIKENSKDTREEDIQGSMMVMWTKMNSHPPASVLRRKKS